MVNINLNKTGERIRALFKKKDIQTVVIAKRLGVDPTSVRRWKRGEGLPGYEHLFEMADILKVSIEDILYLERN